MRPVVSLSVCMCLCVLDVTMRSAKTDEPIEIEEMSFGAWTRVGLKIRVLSGVLPPGEATIWGTYPGRLRGAHKLPQRVRAEPGRQTYFGAFQK